ncbi:hypothetical protein FRC01_011370 [Tulasnella sp. 417]|nr:hypothetical protein FRC01_011370 [Tulasnella sp. 417]
MFDLIFDQHKEDAPPLIIFAPPPARKVLESLSTLRIESRRIIPLETEGCKRGASADVIPAVLTPDGASQPTNFAHVQHVAVKKLRLDYDTDDARVLALLAHEMNLLNNLSHSNIVKVIGFVEDAKDGTAWIVLPWEKNGNLREFIAAAEWEFPERIALLNVLVSSMNEAIITDFGSARSVEFAPGKKQQSEAPSAGPGPDTRSPKAEVSASRGTITLTSAQWTLRWAAPELLAGRVPDLASDIWAFGWICWEIMTSNFPFDGENDVSVALHIVEGKHPLVHSDDRLQQVVALANLMTDCWNLHPNRRPTANSCERQVYWMDRTRPRDRSGGQSSEFRSAELLSSIAFTHIKHNRLSEAMELLPRCISIARSTKDEQAGADALHSLAEIYRLRGEYSKAGDSYIAAGEIFARTEDEIGFANAVNGLGEVYRLRGEYCNAEKAFIIARDIYAKIGNDLGLSNAVKALGDVYRLRGKYSEASLSYLFARNIYVRIGNQPGLASSASALGDLYQFRGEYPKAEKFYLAARHVYARIGDQGGLANAVNALGDVYRLQGEYSKARASYLSAQNIYARAENRIGVANAVKALGDVYGLRGEYNKAEESYITAFDTYSKVGDLNGVANAVKALGDVHRMRGEYFKAEELYVSARKIYAQIGYQGGLADVARGLGDVYRLQGKYLKAEGSYGVARDVYARIGDQIGLANALTGIGHIFIKYNDYARADQSYQEARAIYARIGNKYSLANNLLNTGWMYRSQKRYEEAEKVVSEASTLFGELGLEKEWFECDGFLRAIRKKKPKKWKRVLKARLSRFIH